MSGPVAYYNEVDPYAAQWLRNLAAARLIRDGHVDERSIRDVHPDDLAGYRLVHLFAGIAGWDLAAQLAGWPDDLELWTGSCPCQPFSAAGKRGGFDDDRHLWPEMFRLVDARRPAVVVGEQVASRDGLAWLDAVFADLEGAGYACRAVDLCAAGVGAPHIRQRLWWVGVADAAGVRRERVQADAGGDGASDGRSSGGGPERRPAVEPPGARSPRGLGHAERLGAGRDAGASAGPQGGAGVWPERDDARSSGATRGVADLRGARLEGRDGTGERADAQRAPAQRSGDAGRVEDAAGERLQGRGGPGGLVDAIGGGFLFAGSSAGDDGARRPRPAHVDWRDADWLLCRDGKWRPVEPGTFPLAHGIPARVGRLRAFGNAINPSVAALVLEAVLADLGYLIDATPTTEAAE